MMKQGIVAISFVLKRSCIMYHIHWESKNKRQFLCSESQVPFWQVKPQHFQLLLTGFFFFAHSCGVPASLGSACLSQTHTNTHKHIYIYTCTYTEALSANVKCFHSDAKPCSCPNEFPSHPPHSLCARHLLGLLQTIISGRSLVCHQGSEVGQVMQGGRDTSAMY